MYLAQNLKCLRKQRGLTQQELADILGVKRSTVANWESSKREPEIDMLVCIAEYFNMSLDNLVLKELKPLLPLYASNIKYLRKRQEITQEDMAKLLEVSKSNMSKYESGAVELSNQGLIKVSEIFNVTIDDLLKKDLAKEDV
ncbi:MAG: helix-turn-helix transcriptional regulator [Hungatella sp.]|nr:helix-turn-helix transcriptional regulator [Hungatella sp.]